MQLRDKQLVVKDKNLRRPLNPPKYLLLTTIKEKEVDVWEVL
jgi:hypothetical protein